MATQNPFARSIGSAVVAWLGVMGAAFGRDARHRRQEELLLELISHLTRVTEELHRANLIQLHRITSEQVDRAMEDPALAAAMSTLENVPDHKRRQLLFANREYAAILLGHRIGAYDWDGLIGHLRVLCRNPVFAEYWDRTDEHRRSLPRQLLEAKVGEAVDAIMEELAEGPSEWWVAGPSEEPSV